MQMRTRLFRAFGYRSCLQSANRRPSLRRLRAVRVAMPRLLFRHDGCWNAAGRLVEDGPPYEGEYRLPSKTASACPLGRSEEHTSELQSLMRNSYAVFCLTKNICHQPYEGKETILEPVLSDHSLSGVTHYFFRTCLTTLCWPIFYLS